MISSRYSCSEIGGVGHRVEIPPEEAEEELAEVKEAVEQDEVPGGLLDSCWEPLACPRLRMPTADSSLSQKAAHAWRVSQMRTRFNWYSKRSVRPRKVLVSHCTLQRLVVGLTSEAHQ